MLSSMGELITINIDDKKAERSAAIPENMETALYKVFMKTPLNIVSVSALIFSRMN